MTEEEWLASESSFAMLCYLKSRSGRYRLRKHFGRAPTVRKLRLFLVECSRRVSGYLADERSFHALEVAERFADNRATSEELASAAVAAQAAYSDVRSTDRREEYYAAAVVLEAAREERRFNWTSALELCIYGADVAARLVGIAKANGENHELVEGEEKHQAALIRDLFGNCPSAESPTLGHKSQSVIDLAKAIYEERSFEGMPILADALEDSGCCDDSILAHLRNGQEHIKGCWLLDLVLN